MRPYFRPFARDHRQINPTGAEEASNVFFSPQLNASQLLKMSHIHLRSPRRAAEDICVR